MAISLVNPLDDIKQKLEDLKSATANRSLQNDIKKINKIIAELEKEVKYMNGLGAGSTGSLPGEQLKQRAFVLEHLAERPKLFTALDNLIAKAENQLKKKSNIEKFKAVIELKESRNDAAPAKPATVKHEVLHEQPKYTVEEMRDKERLRRERESARFAEQASKQAAATQAAALHREQMMQAINKRNAVIDHEQNAPDQKIQVAAKERATRDDASKQAKAAFIESVRAEGHKQTGDAPALNATQKVEAQERNMNAITTIMHQRQALNNLVNPDQYKGRAHADLKRDIIKLQTSSSYESELPTRQRIILLATLRSQLETVDARKAGVNKLYDGDYSKWLKSTIKAVESHKISYNTSVLTSSSPHNKAVEPAKVEPPKEPVKSQELGPPPPSIETPPMRRR